LASSKISAIKTVFAQIKDNLAADHDFIPQLIQKDSANHDTPQLANAENEIKKMESLVEKVSNDVPKLVEIQNGLADEGQDELNQSLANLDRKPDTEVQQTMAQMKATVQSYRNIVKHYKDEEQKKKDAQKQKEAENTDNKKERTAEDKEALKAFLSGSD